MSELYLIRVLDDSHDVDFEYVCDGMRKIGYAVPTEKTDYEKTDINAYTFYEVHEGDIDAIIKHLSSRNPGKEVIAYKPIKAGIRPPGEVVYKVYSSSGVLPA